MDKKILALTIDSLNPLVRQCLSNPDATVSQWQATEVHGGSGGAIGGTAIYRLTGQTTSKESWSLILKILYQRPDEGEDAPYYWKREYEICRSGMLENLPNTGLKTPIIYGTEDFSDSCWIWMEDIIEVKKHWTLADYGLVARRIGHFNGAYLLGEVIPDYRWLNFNWHCRITHALDDTFNQLDTLLQNPLTQRALPLAEKEAILEIWNERQRFCDALQKLPQTLCHIDAFRRNVFHSDTETIVIDWALAGKGAIGEDLVAMVAMPLYFRDFKLSDASDLDKAVFDAYIVGLRDVGWTGNAQLARIGYTCSMALRGLAGVRQDLILLADESRHPNMQRNLGLEKLEDIADLYAKVRRFRLIKMAAEARQLIG